MQISNQLKQSLISVSMAVMLAACGGGGGGTTTPAPTPTPTPDPTPAPTPNIVSVTTAAEAVQNRLACNKGTADTECNLRIYQIMVEAFVDGDNTADYNAGYGTSNHKGDLKGITASLDYIKSLGVNAIWLTPIFKSAPTSGQDIWADRLDATGYFATDYFSIDPKFGTLTDAQNLVNQAHAKGLYVFFDGVFGHHKSGTVAPSPNGLTPAGGNDPVDYTNAQTLNFYKEVATYWVNQLKIDGWRLDQAYQVPISAWASIKTAVQTASAAQTYTDSNGNTVNPLGYMVGEIWKGETNIASEGYGTANTPGLNSAFDFPSRYKLVQTFATQEDTAASNARVPSGTNLNGAFATYSAYPDFAKPNLMIGNHDLVRLGDLIQRAGLANPSDAEYWDRHKAAFSFLTAHSGPITIYYNDEIGAEVSGFAAKADNNTCAAAGLCDDHVARSQAQIDGVATTFGGTPFVLAGDALALKNYVKKLMQIRAANPALSIGSRTHIFSNSNLFIDRKDAGSNHVLYLVNTQKTEATVTLDASVLAVTSNLTDLIDGTTTISVNGSNKYVITVPALGSRFLSF